MLHWEPLPERSIAALTSAGFLVAAAWSFAPRRSPVQLEDPALRVAPRHRDRVHKIPPTGLRTPHQITETARQQKCDRVGGWQAALSKMRAYRPRVRSVMRWSNRCSSGTEYGTKHY